jgi:ATP-dependent DNA helicase DinG
VARCPRPRLRAFPFARYRAGQREALDAARAAFDDGHRVVVVEAPTGAGKSAIAVTLAREARSAYLLTGQKVLQDQYQRDFDDLAMLKGRANYPCEVAPTHAAAAPCIAGQTFPECAACSYFRAKDRALAAPRALLNYAYFLHELNYAGGFRPRELLVLDEAHNAEALLMGFVQAQLSDAQLAGPASACGCRGSRSPRLLFEFAEDLRPRLAQRARELDATLGVGALPPDVELDQLRVRQWLDGRRAARLARRHPRRRRRLGGRAPLRGPRPAAVFKPVAVAPFAEELLFDHADHALLLSATVLDPETFLRGLGVEPEEAAVVQVASTFPPERRPLVVRPVARLTRHHLDRDLPKLVAEVCEIMFVDHETEKGVVHAHSYRIAGAVLQGCRPTCGARVVTHHDAAGREAALEAHLTRPEPTVLLSPSMTEGLDLAGDLARWQVICKLPYPYLGDPQVAARRAEDPGWYDWRTCLTLVQAYGRAVRSEDDHAVTYLLDADAPAFLQRQRHRLPPWFLDAPRCAGPRSGRPASGTAAGPPRGRPASRARDRRPPPSRAAAGRPAPPRRPAAAPGRARRRWRRRRRAPAPPRCRRDRASAARCRRSRGVAVAHGHRHRRQVERGVVVGDRTQRAPPRSPRRRRAPSGRVAGPAKVRCAVEGHRVVPGPRSAPTGLPPEAGDRAEHRVAALRVAPAEVEHVEPGGAASSRSCTTRNASGPA